MRSLRSAAGAFALAMSLGACVRLNAQSCGKASVQGDADIWSAKAWYLTRKDTRDWIASIYGLKHEEWDGGWGWAKYNDANPDRYGFTKMMSAVDVLQTGVTAEPSSQGAWSAALNLPSTADIRIQSQFAVASREANSIDVLYTDFQGVLSATHLTKNPWYAGSNDLTTSTINVSDAVADTKDNYRAVGPFQVLSLSPQTLDVFARRADDLLHFQFSEAHGWSVDNLTTRLTRPTPLNGSDRYDIGGAPLALRRGDDNIDIVAVDRWGHLIRYHQEHGGAWEAEDVSLVTGGALLTQLPVMYSLSASRVDVFGYNPDQKLLHFWWTVSGTWSVENVTDLTSSQKTLVGVPTVVSPDGMSLLVVTRTTDGVVAYVKAPGWPWWEIDYSQQIGMLESDPVAVSRKHNSFDVFARGINNNLLHYYWNESGIQWEDVSLKVEQPRYPIDGSITVLAGNDRLDVFSHGYFVDAGVNLFEGHVFHYYWSPDVGWKAEDLLAAASVSAFWNRIDGPLYVLKRGSSSLHVFGAMEGFPTQVVHLTAAAGGALRPWHFPSEYSFWPYGPPKDYEYKPSNADNGSTDADSERGGAFYDDRVKMWCSGFRISPSERAAVLLHEATHMVWWNWPHQANPPGKGLGCKSACSDNWFFHNVGDPAGDLSWSHKNHSMYQMNVEFLCDMSEYARSDEPISAFVGARLQANFFLDDRILNPPGWTCGVPRPFSG